MTRSLTVAALQWRTGGDVDRNATDLAERARVAADRGAALVVAPEASLACYGSDLRAVAQPLDAGFVTGLRALAADLGIWLVVGTFVPTDDGRVRNVAVLTNGEVLHHYAKVHLYDAFGARESDTVEPGDALVTADLLGTRVGLAICYDLRFADQFTALGRSGCEVICVPTAWGVGPGKVDQLRVLARARAMDAQAHVVVADQSGGPQPTADPLGVGYSVIASPLGKVHAEAGEQPETLLATLDLDDVARVRTTVPIGVEPPSL